MNSVVVACEPLNSYSRCSTTCLFLCLKMGGLEYDLRFYTPTAKFFFLLGTCGFKYVQHAPLHSQRLQFGKVVDRVVPYLPMGPREILQVRTKEL